MAYTMTTIDHIVLVPFAVLVVIGSARNIYLIALRKRYIGGVWHRIDTKGSPLWTWFYLISYVALGAGAFAFLFHEMAKVIH